MPRLFGQRVSPSGPRGGIRTAVAVIPASPVNTAATAAVTEMTCPLTSVLATDIVVVNPVAALKAGLGFLTCRVVAANVLGVSVINPTAALITIANITMQVEMRRYPAQSAGPAAP
jgi:hypothetical protein